MTKEKLIKNITEFIPSSKAGTDREWSDNTKWFVDKLKKSGKRELDFCYKELLSEKIKRDDNSLQISEENLSPQQIAATAAGAQERARKNKSKTTDSRSKGSGASFFTPFV